MKIEEVCEALDGSEYPIRIESAFCDILKEDGIVVVYGASDDLMEFRGAIYDELGAYDGGTAYLDKNGLLQNDCYEGDACPHFAEIKSTATKIKAKWCESDVASWEYETAIPHKTFKISEGDETYCVGIVFLLADVEH